MSRTSTSAVAATCALALASLTACASSGSAQADFQGTQIRWIVASAAGGGFDTTTRQLEPTFTEALDTSAVVENLDGGGFAIGPQTALNAPPDCSTIVTHAIPHLNFSYLTQEVDYDLEDFAVVGGISIEPGVLRVQNDAPWETIQDFVEDARSRPGEITVSVSDIQSNNYLALLTMEQQLDLDFNIVGYDGGGPSRNALLSGEVDATHAGVFNSLSIQDDTRVLAVSQAENQWPEVTDDAPTINEALGSDLPDNASNYMLVVPADCREENPERYQLLVDTLRESLQDEDYLATLEELGEEGKVDYLTEDEVLELAAGTEQEIAAILEETPDAFTS